MGRKGKELSPDLKRIAVDLFRNGEKISDIARILQKPRSTISGIIRRFQDAGTIENRPRSGSPRAMLDRDYRQLEKIVKKDQRTPLAEISSKFNEQRDVQVSKRTVRRLLRDNGFSRGVYRKKVVIKFDNRKKRLSWCREKRWWTTQYQWSKVIFSDESQVCIVQARICVEKSRGRLETRLSAK
ncbi:unnamed protein product [Mytilus coruscus]|uniref:Transposase Tc1-like domain-containing protein n=1 Tax=Mytilus coruscus TaxID=42192 RepID=A0A6J7ZZ58_MYTCO|nr:unnamed protein product [Mytilus coruscus]